MKVNPRLYPAVVALVLVIAACSCGDVSSLTSSGKLLIQNNSSVDICSVYISPATDEDWGSDDMNDGESIAPGASREFTNLAGELDVLVEDCSENTLLEEYGVMVNQDATTTQEVTDPD